MCTDGTLHCGRYLPNRANERKERFVISIKNILYWFFRDDERVPGRRRFNIKEGECVSVLIDNLDWNLASNNFHKNSVFHPASIQ